MIRRCTSVLFSEVSLVDGWTVLSWLACIGAGCLLVLKIIADDLVRARVRTQILEHDARGRYQRAMEEAAKVAAVDGD